MTRVAACPHSLRVAGTRLSLFHLPNYEGSLGQDLVKVREVGT